MEQMTMINRKIIISEPITDHLADRVIAQLLEISDYDEAMGEALNNYQAEPVEMFINSGGGSATAGFAIISAMELCNTPIVTYGIGLVASMALAIFVAGDVRIGHRFCRFMYHSVMYGEDGTIQDHIDSLEEVTLIQEMYNGLLDENTDFPKEIIKDTCEKKKNYFFSANKAKKYGVVHEVMLKPVSPVQKLSEDELAEVMKQFEEAIE